MSSVKVEVVKAFTKEEALEQLGMEVGDLYNGTQKWKNVGEPVVGTKPFEVFANDYLTSKKAKAAIVVLKAGSADTRENPYKVVNVKTEGKRTYKTTYQIVEAELKVVTGKEKNEETGKEKEVIKKVEVISRGAVVDTADKKSGAEAKVKELISANKRNYVVDIVKEVTEGQAIASYGIYTPSKSAVEGQFAIIIKN